MNEERFLHYLTELIRIDSPSLQEKEISEYLKAFFKARGLEVRSDDSGRIFGSNGENLLVHIEGTMEGEAICFNAHMDTVEPGQGIEPYVEDGKMMSRGNTVLGADDKCGIAVLMEALDYLTEHGIPHREMYYLFTVSEEIMKGARHYDTSHIGAKYICALDGAGSPAYLCEASAGKMAIRLEFIGKTAHAGIDIEKGINAVCMAAEAVTRMPSGKIDADTMINIASFHAGDEKPVVPGSAKLSVEVKSFKQDRIDEIAEKIKKVSKCAAEKWGGSVIIEEEKICGPLCSDGENKLYERTKKEIIKQGMQPVILRTGGSGDANVFAEKGFICHGMCMGMYHVHTTEEYLDLLEVKAAYQMVYRMMTQ